MPEHSIPAEFVAHRGAAALCPENTLPAIRKALDSGLNWVEIDVQFSSDGIPIVIHDEDLLRTAGRPGRIREMTGAELASVSVHNEASFGKAFFPTPPPLLSEATGLLQAFPRARMFVELRVDGIAFMGTEQAMQRVNHALGPQASQCIILSYDTGVLELARSHYGYPIGWVLSDYSAETRKRAASLAADFLFADIHDVPAGEHLFSGPWQWAVYEVRNTRDALNWASRGAGLIESFNACDLAAAFDRD